MEINLVCEMICFSAKKSTSLDNHTLKKEGKKLKESNTDVVNYSRAVNEVLLIHLSLILVPIIKQVIVKEANNDILICYYINTITSNAAVSAKT